MTTTSDRLSDDDKQTLRDIGGQQLIENVNTLLDQMDDELGTTDPERESNISEVYNACTDEDRDLLAVIAE